MAELYLAKDSKKDRLVVIKRILPYLAQEREFVQMFLDEARIASQLHHPNIITVFELGQLEGSIFIAMEYVEGVDLRKVFNEEQKRQGTVPANVTAWLTSKLCAGLHYAHNALGSDGKPLQIIHRDVSPQNLMVGYAGQVKLVDFGIAKAGAFMERSKPGVIKGKFLYLSPEQLSQERIDHRADIFALGTMMYEVSTGKSPFYKATTEAVIYAIRAEEPPPPHLSRRDFPLNLSKIIMKCLAKDRSKRYQQAGEVHHDLEAWMRAEARTSLEDVKTYVARLFGGEDERTSLFIPPNARGPSDRMTDRVAAIALSPAPNTDPVRTARGPANAAAARVQDETTKPLAPMLSEGASSGSIITNNSVITSPIGRRPTPQPIRAVAGPRPAAQPVPRVSNAGAPRPLSNPNAQAYTADKPEPRTQTARPQDLAKAFTAPPTRRPSGEGLRSAGEIDDATALMDSGSSRAQTGESLPSLTPSARTPITTENRSAPPPAARARQSGALAEVPEGVRTTKLPPEPQPQPQRVLRSPTAGVPATSQARKPTRAETGAVFEVPQQFAREQIGGRSAPPVPTMAPTLPPEPSTKEERPQRNKAPSLEDIGPLLDQAIPSAMSKRPAATFDQDDQENTLDLRGKGLSQLGESQDVSGELPSREEVQEPEQDEDNDQAPGLAERPWLVAALVFVVVLVLGLGGLAIYRYRQGRGTTAPPVTKVDPPPQPKTDDPKPPPPTPVEPLPPPSTDVEQTETVMVRFVAPQSTRLLDQRDGTNLTPNTPYRWHPGKRPITYRCPKKGRLQAPDVTYNVDVKSGQPEQSFTISCK